jgi:hypothetical protein
MVTKCGVPFGPQPKETHTMAKDTWKPVPHKDAITGKQTDSSGNGGSYSIDSKIEKAQRERPNPSR